MSTFEKLTDTGVFMATGYICAGTAIAVLGGIPLFTSYLESSFLLVSIFILAAVLIAGALGILIMHYAVRKIGAKKVYEQDILIYIIGMLFMALTLNKAMFVVGLFISCMALPVFFYENFTRQVRAAREGGRHIFELTGWALGPIVCFLALVIFQDYGILVCRIIFAHFIVLGFWVWVKRLDTHEQYEDAPTLLTHDLPWEEHRRQEAEKMDAGYVPPVKKDSTAESAPQKSEEKAAEADGTEPENTSSVVVEGKAHLTPEAKSDKKDDGAPLGI